MLVRGRQPVGRQWTFSPARSSLAETYEETLKRKKQFEEIFQSDSEITRNLSLYPERDSSDSELRNPRVDEVRGVGGAVKM